MMTASIDQHHHQHAGAVAESLSHIRRAVNGKAELQDVTTLTDKYSMTGQGGEPWIEVIEQPKSSAMRFRYLCEGRSAGTILGVSATAAQKTYPTIRVSRISARRHAPVCYYVRPIRPIFISLHHNVALLQASFNVNYQQ